MPYKRIKTIGFFVKCRSRDYFVKLGEFPYFHQFGFSRRRFYTGKDNDFFSWNFFMNFLHDNSTKRVTEQTKNLIRIDAFGHSIYIMVKLLILLWDKSIYEMKLHFRWEIDMFKYASVRAQSADDV